MAKNIEQISAASREKILVDRHNEIISGKEARRRINRLRGIERDLRDGGITEKTAKKLLREKRRWTRLWLA